MSQIKVIYHDINQDAEVGNRVPYKPPFDPNNFGSYAINFLIGSFLMMSFFVINYLSQKAEDRSLFKQLFFALISSALAAVGFTFAIMECGIYL